VVRKLRLIDFNELPKVLKLVKAKQRVELNLLSANPMLFPVHCVLSSLPVSYSPGPVVGVIVDVNKQNSGSSLKDPKMN
jgi:hypothetical protein